MQIHREVAVDVGGALLPRETVSTEDSSDRDGSTQPVTRECDK